jgi:GH24 family phage-related lysozyme (muramidase)
MTLLLVIAVVWFAPGNKLMSECYIRDSRFENLDSTSFKLDRKLSESERKNYEAAIDFIKLHEGFANGRAYRCVSGKLTIGYGHVIQAGERFPEQISERFADCLLRADFRVSFATADKLYPEIRGSRKIVLAHFVYSKGIGSLLKSGLRKKIDNGGSVDEEFAKWCYYTDCKTGKKVYSKMAASIQKWENAMWHQDDILYVKAELQKRGYR